MGKFEEQIADIADKRWKISHNLLDTLNLGSSFQLFINFINWELESFMSMTKQLLLAMTYYNR